MHFEVQQVLFEIGSLVILDDFWQEQLDNSFH